MKITAAELCNGYLYDRETGKFKNKKTGNSLGYHNYDGYVVIRIGKYEYKAHRLAWLYVKGKLPSLDIDHINGIRSDNRFSNLREATRQENIRNIHKSRISGKPPEEIGVDYCKRNKKWRSRIWDGTKEIHLGWFIDKESAMRARKQKASELFGNFYNI